MRGQSPQASCYKTAAKILLIVGLVLNIFVCLSCCFLLITAKDNFTKGVKEGYKRIEDVRKSPEYSRYCHGYTIGAINSGVIALFYILVLVGVIMGNRCLIMFGAIFTIFGIIVALFILISYAGFLSLISLIFHSVLAFLLFKLFFLPVYLNGPRIQQRVPNVISGVVVA